MAIDTPPSPGELVKGMLEHAMPFIAVSLAIWKVLMQALDGYLEGMQRAAELHMQSTPQPVDERAELRAGRAEVQRREDALIAAGRAAVTLPLGVWLTPTRRRRNAAIAAARAGLATWEDGGRDDAEREQRLKVSSHKRRASRKILAFNASAETARARDVIAAMPGVRRMVVGMAELPPDKELYGVLMSTAARRKLNIEGAFEVLKRRAAIAAAQAGASAATGDYTPLPTPARKGKRKPADAPAKA